MPDGSNNFSDRNLALAYWFSKHRHQLKRGRVLLLVGVVGIILLIAGILLVIWLINIPQTNQIRQDVAQSPVIFDSATDAVPVQAVQTQIVPRDTGLVDIVIQMRNPNASWSATAVDIDVQVAGLEPVTERITLAPEQDYYIVRTAVSSTTSAPSVQATVTNTVWERTPDPEIFPEPNWQFENTDIRQVTSAQEGAPKTEMSFDVRNNSVFGYRNVEAVVLILDSNGSVAAIGSQPIGEVNTFETAPVVLRWPTTVRATSEALIYVNTDVLTESRVIR